MRLSRIALQLGLTSLGLILAHAPLSAADVKGSVTTQWIGFPDSEPQNHSFGRSATLNLELYQRFEQAEFVADITARLDDKDSGRRNLDATDAYVKTYLSELELYAGNRKIFWGKVESKNIVDVINQRDASANSGQTEKLGALSFSAEKYFDETELQFFFLPGFNTKTYNDADSHPSTGLAFAAPEFERKDGKKADELAARFSGYYGGLDYALSGFYGTARDPIISPKADGKLRPYYAMQRSIGVEGQYTSEAVLLKLEVLFGKQGTSDFFAAVTGVEKTLYAVWDTQWDAGLIGEVQFDDRPQVANELFGVVGVRLLLNDPQDTNFLVLHSSDREYDQTLLSLKGSRRLSESLFLEVNGSFFNARTPSSSFGMLSDDDQISAQLKWFF